MKRLLYIIVLLLIVGGALFLLTKVTEIQENQIAVLEDKIEFLKEEHTPLKFKITERDASSLKYVVKFYDADGKMIKGFEHQMQGHELMFDFFLVKVSERFIAFPYKVFTDAIAPDDGVSLIPYYESESGFPQVFYYKGIDPELKKALTALLDDIESGKIHENPEHFGSAVHDLAGIKRFKVNYRYKIVSRNKGGIEVVED